MGAENAHNWSFRRGEKREAIFKQVTNNGAESCKTDERHHPIDSRSSTNHKQDMCKETYTKLHHNRIDESQKKSLKSPTITWEVAKVYTILFWTIKVKEALYVAFFRQSLKNSLLFFNVYQVTKGKR